MVGQVVLEIKSVTDWTPRSFGNEDVDALRDLASMVERELAAVQMATLDELTGISNRRGFMMLSQYSINLCIREKMPATLIFMDLDKFKPINDTLGHAEGDAALMAFASLMKSAFRDSDLFARLGGDEFIVLLSNATKQQAEEVIEKFSRLLMKYNQEADLGYEIAFSHGIVEFNPEIHSRIEDLLENGDSLMYKVKATRG